MEIKKTSDYSRFYFFRENRNPLGVKKIKKSIEEIDLTPYSPILVTPDYGIIDGQNRFLACKELQYPIYYMVFDANVDYRKALKVLNVQIAWKPTDYLHFYSKIIGGCFTGILDFMKKYQIGLETAKVVYGKTIISSSAIRKGELFEKWDKADDIMEYLSRENFQQIKYAKYRQFVRAVRKVFCIYSNKRLEKLHEIAPAIPQLALPEQYLTYFDNMTK